MMRQKIIPFFLLVLASCGSVSDKEFSAHGLKEVPFGASIKEALSSGNFKEGQWLPKDWWESFHDECLSALMEKTIDDNPTLGAATQQIKAYEQRAKVFRSQLLPTLDLDINYAYEHFSKHGFFRAFVPIPAVISQTDINFNFNYELDFWGKNRFRFQSVLNDAKAKAAEGALSKLIVTIQLARSYFDYIAALKKKQLLERLVSLRLSYFDLTRLRLGASLEDEVEVLSTKIRLADAEKSYEIQVAAVELFLHQINQLVVRDIDDPSGISEDFQITADFFELPENLELDLIGRRPDIMLHIWKVEATADLIGAARAEFYPNINLKLLGGLQSVKFDKLFTLDSWQGLVDPALNLPIFSGGRLTANLKERVAEYEEAIYDYNQAVIQAAKDVADSISSFESLKKQMTIQEEITKETRKNFELISLKEKSRIASYLEVIKKEEQLIFSEIDFIELKRSIIDERLSLIKALGGGY